MSIFDAYHAGRGMVFLLFQSFHSHVWRPAVIPLAFDRRRYQEPPLLPLMVNVLGPKVLEQKVLGPKGLETTNHVFDPSGGITFVSSLISAAGRDHLDVIKYLADEWGVDIDATTPHGDTALVRAAHSGHLDVVK